MRGLFKSSKVRLISFFVVSVAIGSVVLTLPAAWGEPGRLRYLDALFTATSAVSVTGLIVVNTSEFSRFGHMVIVVLIQIGGLGIIAFGSILIAYGRRVSLASRSLVTEYFVETVEYEPRRILRRVVGITFAGEAIGFAVLYAGFQGQDVSDPAFTALFHAVSAFCNAGFSLFDRSMMDFAGAPSVLIPIVVLVIVGGAGFVVWDDVGLRMMGKRRRLSLHSRVVIGASITLLLVGSLLFGLLEGGGTLEGMGPGSRAMNAFFQAATPRTAGFNSLEQADLTAPARLATMGLMFVGGAPAGVAGGIKVTTLVLIIMMAVRSAGPRRDVHLAQRSIPKETLVKAAEIVVKSLLIVGGALFVLTVTELWHAGADFRFEELMFEIFSAFSTVGLSLGITGELSDPGRVVVIATMLTGRIGIVTMSLPPIRRQLSRSVRYPEGRLMLG